MKTKNASKGSPGLSNVSWRNLKQGEKKVTVSATAATAQFRIGGYVRLSPSPDDREEGSLVSHPQRIKQFVESKNIQHGGNWGEIVDWYVDKDFSGKDMNRPGFQKMLQDIQTGKINAVIVTELSRLNRKVKDFCEVYDFFKEHNVAFFCLRENFDTSTAIGELMLIQAMGFAQYERHTIVDRIKRGSRARAERGLANGVVPLGYKPVAHRPNYREIEEVEKPLVELIFRKFLELRRISRVVTYLNDQGYKTKTFISKHGRKVGGNRWGLASVHNVLTNRVYLGEREINKWARTSSSDLKEDEKYFFVKAHWPAIVTDDVFSDVQRLLESNKKKARKYVHEYRLTGLIVCSQCGAELVGKSGTGRTGKYFYYGHKRKMLVGSDRHLQRCKTENVKAALLEEAVINRLKEFSRDPSLIAELAKKAGADSGARAEHLRALMGSQEQERRRIQQSLDNIYDTIAETDDKALRAALTKKAQTLHADLEKVELSLSASKADFEKVSNVVDAKSVFQLLKVFRDNFEKQSASIQSDILKEFIRRIVIVPDGAIFEIFGSRSDFISNSVVGGSDHEENQEVKALTRRTLVRTVYKLVAGAGFEPTTFGL